MTLNPRLAAEVLAGLGDAVVETDPDGRITGWHAGAEKLLGFRAAEMLGQQFPDLFTDQVGTLGGAPELDAVLPVRRRKGADLVVAVSIRPSPAGTVAVLRPMSPMLDPVHTRRRANPDWDRTLGRIVRGLVEVAERDLTALEQTDTVAKVLVDRARLMLPEVECMLSLVPHDRQENFRIIAGAGPWGASLVGNEWPRAGTVAGLAMERRRPIETVRLPEQSMLQATLGTGQISTGRLVPLWTAAPLPDGRTAIGVLGFYRRERRYFTPYERRLIGEFSRLASLLLQGAELHAAAARAEARLLRTIDAAYQFTRTLSPDELLQNLVALGVAVGADYVRVVRQAGDSATVLASDDHSAPRGADGMDLVSVAADLGRLVVSDEVLQHVVAMPVAGDGNGSVVLVLTRRRDPAFPSDDLAQLQTVASMAGVALRNAWLYGEVQEAGRVKTEFLNMAAHELRTPLTVIRGYLSMLREGSFGHVPPAFLDPLELLQIKTDELGHLVDDLLLAARLDAGRMALNRRPLDLNELARQVTEELRPLAHSVGAHLRLEPARRPVVVDADPELLERVLHALVGNGLVFGGPASLSVRVAVHARDGAGRVEVEDTGRGIAVVDRERIFERFSRLDDERFPRQSGTGLGLHIARALAERQGGSIALEWSEPDRGSRFVVSLPEVERLPDD